MAKIFIFGTNDCAELAQFYLTNDSVHSVAGFFVDKDHKEADQFSGLPVLTWNELPSPAEAKLFIPLYDNRLREEKANKAKYFGYDLISYVSSKATVWSDVGENCFIMEDNTIQPFVEIGDNVIMWSGNHIGHHSVIKSNVFISSHVVVSGHCVIESYSWLGVNSALRDNITVAENTFVSMSSMIHKKTKPNKMYMGVPAKPIRDV